MVFLSSSSMLVPLVSMLPTAACSSKRDRFRNMQNDSGVLIRIMQSFRVQTKSNNLLTTHVKDDVLHAHLALTLGALLLLIDPTQDPETRV
jgi:hypothetical protein